MRNYSGRCITECWADGKQRVMHDARPMLSVRAIDQARLGGVARAICTHILSPPYTVIGAVEAGRPGSVADTLNHHEPTRALSEYMVANTLSRLIPICLWVLRRREAQGTGR